MSLRRTRAHNGAGAARVCCAAGQELGHRGWGAGKALRACVGVDTQRNIRIGPCVPWPCLPAPRWKPEPLGHSEDIFSLSLFPGDSGGHDGRLVPQPSPGTQTGGRDPHTDNGTQKPRQSQEGHKPCLPALQFSPATKHGGLASRPAMHTGQGGHLCAQPAVRWVPSGDQL